MLYDADRCGPTRLRPYRIAKVDQDLLSGTRSYYFHDQMYSKQEILVYTAKDTDLRNGIRTMVYISLLTVHGLFRIVNPFLCLCCI